MMWFYHNLINCFITDGHLFYFTLATANNAVMNKNKGMTIMCKPF